jgi:8-oxo-dGTP pyrophosphatase MutT (NUDIX family)
MSKPKQSRCAFVVIKLRMGGEDYFLMRRDPDWKDISFIGGHANKGESSNLERVARRELLEEVPALRSFKLIELVPLTNEIKHGPVYSPSAKCDVVYDLRFFLLRFGGSPEQVVKALGPRTPNILVHRDDLLAPRKYRVAELVKVLDGSIPGGLRSMQHSWPEDLGNPAQGGVQAELAF